MLKNQWYNVWQITNQVLSFNSCTSWKILALLIIEFNSTHRCLFKMNNIVRAGLFECLILEIISELNEVRAIYKKGVRMVRGERERVSVVKEWGIETRERKSVIVRKEGEWEVRERVLGSLEGDRGGGKGTSWNFVIKTAIVSSNYLLIIYQGTDIALNLNSRN